MEQNNEKTPILVHIDNYTGTEPIRIIYREDDPEQRPKILEAKDPKPFDIAGIITAPADWLDKRHSTFDHLNARVEVRREDGNITLILNETDFAPAFTDIEVTSLRNGILSRSTVSGNIQYTDLFRRLNINVEDSWIDPLKLASFLRLNRNIFADTEQGMMLISILKNIKAKVAADYEKVKDTYTGSRTEHYQQTVEHNLPRSFDVILPIFKGQKPEKYNIEFDVDIVDGKILLQLKSPAINEMVQSSRDEIIDQELNRIRTTAPDIVIIEK